MPFNASMFRNDESGKENFRTNRFVKQAGMVKQH
jgi:hypothetical protein